MPVEAKPLRVPTLFKNVPLECDDEGYVSLVGKVLDTNLTEDVQAKANKLRQRIADEMQPYLDRNGGELFPTDTPDKMRGCLKAIGMELEFADGLSKPSNPREHRTYRAPQIFNEATIVWQIKWLHRDYQNLLIDFGIPSLTVVQALPVLNPVIPSMSVKEGLYWIGVLSSRLNIADTTTKSKPARRNRAASPKPLTARQAEVMQVVGEHKGNISKAAEALGRDRKTVKQAYDAAAKKLGRDALPNAKTVPMRHDRRGQVDVSEDRR